MTDQLDLFTTGQVRSHRDAQAAAAARDAALDRVIAAVSADTTAHLGDVVMHVARNHEDWTTDDVWAALGDCAGFVSEPRVLGSVLRSLAKRGLIRPTEHYRNSTRPACHARPVKVWRATTSAGSSGG